MGGLLKPALTLMTDHDRVDGPLASLRQKSSCHQESLWRFNPKKFLSLDEKESASFQRGVGGGTFLASFIFFFFCCFFIFFVFFFFFLCFKCFG